LTDAATKVTSKTGLLFIAYTTTLATAALPKDAGMMKSMFDGGPEQNTSRE
jgi:hypothetical protein